MSGKKLILYFLFLLVYSNSSGCGKEDTFYNTDPDSVVAAMINSKRMVMLGENPHINVILYQSLVNILDKWIEISEKSRSKHNSLILVLEMDSSSAQIINSYIRTGNDSLMKENIVPEAYYETIEFYSNLRKFQIRLDSVINSSNLEFSFSVKGFENIGINIDTSWLKKCKRESELYFINDRDSSTAYNIIRFLDENPNTKVVMLYGSAHLQYGLVNKNYGFDDLKDEETKGYYLPYYLKNEYGKENVITINQFTEKPSDLPNSIIKYYTGKPLLVKPEVSFGEHAEYYYDLVLFRPYEVMQIHRFSFIFSNFMLRKLSDIVASSERYLPGYKAFTGYWNTLSDIYFVTGMKYKNSKELLYWLDSTKNDDRFDRLDSKEFELEMYKLYNESLNNPAATGILLEFGFEEKDLSQGPLDTNEWHNKVWLNAQTKIKFTNSIGIYWFGYPDEKIKAKEYLVKFSGEDFAEPEKYLQWYRMKYYGYEY